MIKIRPFDKEKDYPAFATLANNLRLYSPTPPGTEGSWRLADCNRPSYEKWGRFVAEKEGEMVGIIAYSQPMNNYHPQKFEVYIGVYPEYQRQGLGTALYQAFSEVIAPYDPIEINADSYDDIPSRLQFWQKQGFTEAWRFVISHLNVGTFDPHVCQKAVEQVAASGIVIRTYAELADDPARDSKLDDLNLRLLRELPNWDPATPFEQTRREYFQECPGFLPDAWFIALDQDRYVGVSGLNRPGEIQPEEKEYLYTGMTGTLAEYRGRGIASTLKLRAALYAKENHVPEIRTWGANRAMQAINAKMGFVQEQPGWVYLTKELATATEVTV